MTDLFKYFLFSGNKKPFYEDENGLIQEGDLATLSTLRNNYLVSDLTWSFGAFHYNFHWSLLDPSITKIVLYYMSGVTWHTFTMEGNDTSAIILDPGTDLDVYFQSYIGSRLMATTAVITIPGGSSNLNDPRLLSGSRPAHLQHAPDGWRDVLVKYGRNLRYWGLIREFTTAMKFRLDGSKILKWIFWNILAMESICYLGISKLNKALFPDKYETWYVGDLDFSDFVQGTSEVSINVMEGGPNKYLKAFENTIYDIPVDEDPQAFKILFDGMPFTNSIRYTVIENQRIAGQTEGAGIHYWLGVAIVQSEGSTEGVLVQDEDFAATTAFPNDLWFLHSETKNISVKIEGSIPVHCLTNNPLTFLLERINDGDFARNDTWILYETHHDAGEDFTVLFNQIVDIQPTEKLYIRVNAGFESGLDDSFVLFEGTFNVGYDVTFQATKGKAIYPLRLFQKLIEKITDGKYTGESTLLQGLTDIGVASGQSIRNHEGDDNATVHGSVIRTNLSDFFKSFNRLGIGLGIRGNVVFIEKWEYFFQDTVILELGVVDKCTFSVAKDIQFNTIKVGQLNQTYDSINGKDEFAVTQQYTTPHTRVVKELDLISPYRSDMYGIELTRLNLYGKDTTDNSADNDTFLINIEKVLTGDSFKLNRPVFPDISGLLHPAGAFNILLSPKRALLENWSFIHSMLDKQDMNFVKFQSGEKNSELIAGGIIEKANVQIGDNTLPNKKILPYYMKFTTSVPLDLQELMTINPYGKISFIYQGIKLYGYLWDGGIKPATNDKQTWTLIASADNDMTKLWQTI